MQPPKHYKLFLLMVCIYSILTLTGCQNIKETAFATAEASADESEVPTAASPESKASANTMSHSASASSDVRDNTPQVLVPMADGISVLGNSSAVIDVSHAESGYICVKYSGDSSKIKLQITGPDSVTYTYNLTAGKDYETFPLTSGNGTYKINVYENVSGNQYSSVASESIDVAFTDEFGAFLYPNQYVDFSADTKAVAKGRELADGASTDLEVISKIYHYVVENITYDKKKASTVTSGYLPDVDDTLSTGKGICFDYAALMTCMLRTQSIPTKLEIGYVGEVYHAWISTYVDDIGWIDNIIEFDGTSWKLMDPTFAAGSSNSEEILQYIGDGDHYKLKYSH